jgi:predicted nucleotidyltransferase component of viral defense system
MLDKRTFELDHIRDFQQSSRRDPILIERVLYAFGLLEALFRVKTPFIFKGGTCLILLLEHPMRLSTDIDILVKPEKYCA